MKKIVLMASATLAFGCGVVTAASAAEGWARSSTWLRAGPGSSYPSITRVHRNEALDVHGCLRRWSWCDVSVDGDRGWLPGDRIALLRDGRRVALPGVAAIFGLGILGFERDLYWRDHYRDRSFYDRGERRGPPPTVVVRPPRPEGRDRHPDMPPRGREPFFHRDAPPSGGGRPPREVGRPFPPSVEHRPPAAAPERPAPAAPVFGRSPMPQQSAPGGCNDSACR